jgi:hypothetical protein
LPSSFVKLQGLNSLIMSNNMVTGTIASMFCNMVSISSVHIASNRFSCYESCVSFEEEDFSGSLEHCHGDEDVALCALAASTNLASLVKILNLAPDPIVVESSHQRYIGTTDANANRVFISVDSVFQYEIKFDSRSVTHAGQEFIRFCADQYCHVVLASYSGSGHWPGSGGNVALLITTKSFYIFIDAMDGSYDSSWGYKIVISPRTHGQGWTCSSLSSHAFSSLSTATSSTLTLASSQSSYADKYCSWTGVVCENNLRFTQLSLKALGIQGSIPSSLGLVTALVGMDLSYNSFSNTIPSFLSNLVGLQLLDVTSNRLQGTIPVAMLNMTALAFLSLANNFLEGPLPDDLSRLTQLQLLRNSTVCRFIWRFMIEQLATDKSCCFCICHQPR